MASPVKVKLNNPELLKWARESAGYSVHDVAGCLKKPIEVIYNWETGEDSPTFKQLEKIANKVKRPVAAFFLPSIPIEPPPPADFRTLPGTPDGEYSPKSLLAFRQARNALAESHELLYDLGIDIAFSLPHCELNDDPEEHAHRLRMALGINVEMQRKYCRDHYQAFDMWRDSLFDYGVVTMVFSMPMEDARAFCLIDHDLAAIGLNSSDAGFAKIFSLFHEVGHLCLRRPGVSGDTSNLRQAESLEQSRVEKFCDRFSAGFLLPADDEAVARAMALVSKDVDMSTIDEIARAFKVSKYVVLRRALDLGYVSDDLYWDVYNKWRAAASEIKRSLKGHPDHVTTMVSHLGKRYTSLVFEALDANHINLYDASRLLSMDPKHFEKARSRTNRGALYAG